MAHAATIYVLCFNDTSATQCNTGNFVMITWDGSAATPTTTTGGTTSNTSGNTVSSGLGTFSIATGSGETVGSWTISGNTGSANFTPGISIASELSYSGKDTTNNQTLNIFWFAYGYPPQDTVNGAPTLQINGTQDAGLGVTAKACGETGGGTDPTLYKACTGTTAIVGGGASTATVTPLGTATSNSGNSFTAFSGGSPFNPGTTMLFDQEVTIVASNGNANKLATGSFFLDPAPAPEPSTFVLGFAGLALLAGKAFHRRKLAKQSL